MIIYYARLYKDPNKGIEEARKVANQRADTDPDSAAAKRLFETARVTVKDDVRKGKMYEVELAPKESDYLDWDKPLSEQPKVRKAIQNRPMSNERAATHFGYTREDFNALPLSKQ